MLPSVSEVLRELTARAPIEPDVAFRAARDVCAEELKRIRDAGGESVPMELLVERALARVAGVPPPLVVPAPPTFVPAEPSEPEPLPAAGPTAAEDPFSETTGALDLRWDRDTREPLAAPLAAASAEEELPLPHLVESAPEPEPEEEERPLPPHADELPAPAAAFAGEPFAAADEEPAAEGAAFAMAGPEEDVPLPEPPPAGAGAEEEFGDETLTRLSREAEAIDLRSVLAGGGPGLQPQEEGYDAAPTASVVDAKAEPAEPPPPPFEDDEDTVLTVPRGGRRRAKGEDGPRWGRLAGIAAALAALAALGYLLVGLWIDRGADSGRVAVARRVPEESGAPAPGASPTPVPEASPAPLPAGGATASVPAESAGPTTPAVARPDAVPTAAPAPPSPSPAVAAAAPVRQSRDGLVVTRDRAGRPEVFSIHFTSYRDRAAAERDLKRVEALAGREGYVAEVDLGEKGIWFRVLVGEFPSAEEAKGVRAELAAKGTRDMGWVYRVVGP